VEGKSLAVAVVLVGLCVMAAGMGVLYGGGPPPPPERPQPVPVTESAVGAALKYSMPIYQGILDEDAKRLDTPPLAALEIRQVNPYFEEWKGHRKLKARSVMQTAHFKITTQVSQEKATSDGQAYRTDHLVLRIENLTPKFLAYRIDTKISNEKQCDRKGDIPHNALVIGPLQTIVRTECLYRADETIDVTRVEVIELPALSAYYVSRLPPALVLYQPRTTAGHVPLKGRLCAQTFSWRDIKEGAEKKELDWRDVIDFYARHNCDEYTFFRSYRYRADPSLPLPARPPEER